MYFADCLCFYNAKIIRKAKCRRSAFAYSPRPAMTSPRNIRLGFIMYQLQEFIVNQRMEIYVKKSASARADDNFTTSDWLHFYGLSGFFQSFSCCSVDSSLRAARDNFRALRNPKSIKEPIGWNGEKLETFSTRYIEKLLRQSCKPPRKLDFHLNFASDSGRGEAQKAAARRRTREP